MGSTSELLRLWRCLERNRTTPPSDIRNTASRRSFTILEQLFPVEKVMKNLEFRTDWPALSLSLLLQVPVVAGSLWIALTASSDFMLGLMLLGPFEIVRVVVLDGLAKAYEKYLSLGQALRYFALKTLLPLFFFGGLFAFYWVTTFGVASLIKRLSQPWIWGAMLVPAALIVAESAVGLIFFRGDPRSQAARLGAMAADAKAWFGLALLFFAVVLCLFLLAAIGHMPGIGVIVIVLLLLFPALYFAGKAIVLAQVYTAYFKRTGRRALDAPWILHLMTGRTPGGYPQVAKNEENAADERRLALRGESKSNLA
jgi:hypothetical protein